MSYIGSWKIDDLLVFTIVTHTVTTGAATDADSAPIYRVYEDEAGTPILTGTMALLDSANTAGFYSEQITLSAANGFEKGKSYNIYIQATVNSVIGATTRNLQIEAEVDANSVSNIGSGVINAAAIADGAIDAGAIAADAITAAKIADGAIDAATFAANAITSTVLANDAITAAKLHADVTTELQSGLATAASVAALNNLSAAQVNAEADAALADVGVTPTVTGRIDAAISTRLASAGYTAPDNSSITAIKAKTDNLPTDPADESLIEAAITAATSGLSTLTAAGVRTALGLASANLDTQLDALPTNAELTTALGAADDPVLTAIGALNNLSSAQVTAAVPTAVQNAAAVLAAAVSNPIDANVQEINDTEIVGNGVSPKFGV